MAGWTALALILVLTGSPASRLACVWECGDAAANEHPATTCHIVAGSGETLTASSPHCPLTPEAAELWTAKGSEPHRLRPIPDLARTADPPAESAAPDKVIAAGLPRLQTTGVPFQSHAVLRI
jgi:hypothetical protein